MKGWSLKLSLHVCTDAKIRNPKNKSYHFPLPRLQFQMQQLKQETCQKVDDDVDYELQCMLICLCHLYSLQYLSKHTVNQVVEKVNVSHMQY